MRRWLPITVLLAACGEPAERAAVRDAAPVDARLADASRVADGEVDEDAAAEDLDAAPVVDAALPPDAEPDLDAAPPAPEGPAVYADDRTLSALTPAVVAHLREVRAAHPDLADDVFAKVGDSITVSQAFLHCFAYPAQVDLGGRDELRSTLDFFRAGDAGGTDPFRRESISAVVGWSAVHALQGDPSPLDREVAAIRPRFALVMYGTNDIERGDIDHFASDLLTITDRLLARGVIPVLSSIPPRDDKPDADALVPSYNGVVRGVAQARQVPFIDLHRELVPLPRHGLGPDGVHPAAYQTDAGYRACDFTSAGLQYGYDVRNLLSLQSLHRLREAVLDGRPAPDPPAPAARGSGSVDDPFVIGALPFSDLRDTRQSPSHTLDGYPSCDRGQDESGPEYVYRFDVARPTTVKAWVLDRDDADVDVHLLANPADAGTCVARNDRVIEADLAPGTWWFVLDTFVSHGTPKPGEYLFVVVPE